VISLTPELDDNPPVEPNHNDRDAARRALACNWPHLETGSPKYVVLLQGLASFHHLFGADRFELRYNLRPPKDRTEEWIKQHMNDQITDTELRDRLKADAERPIDLEMLTSFCDAYQVNLENYSGVLQSAVLRPSDQGTSAWMTKEKAIDKHIAILRDKLPLWRENLETVFEFLDELRITSGAGLVKLGEFEGTSAHWLGQLLFSRMVEAWRSCREVSDRSHRDPRYTYAAKAIDLFAESWLASFPAPQSLSERMREEFILARAAIKRSLMAPSPEPSAGSPVASGTNLSIDNESRELVLLGEMYAIVAQAGHIFRMVSNSDWGIDGEIEFKDGSGQASGKRLYVQLKSGESYLVRRKHDNEEIFSVKNQRHLEYWIQQAYPVMLVIRQSSGQIRWMDVSAYLKENGNSNRQIVFRGEHVTTDSIQKLAGQVITANADL
jgi:hypothetical protein